MKAKNKNQHSLGSSRNGKVHVGTRRLRHACFPSSSSSRSRDSLVAQESRIRDHYPATTVGQEYPFKFIKLSCCRNDSEFRVFYDCNTHTQPSDSTTTLKVNHLEWGPKQWKKGDQRKQTQSLCVCVNKTATNECFSKWDSRLSGPPFFFSLLAGLLLLQ